MAFEELSQRPVVSDSVGLLEGLAQTRAIRRYTNEPVPEWVLRDLCFLASRAPSGSNRQPFRFMVFAEGPKAAEVKALIAKGARAVWGGKRENDSYDKGSGQVENSPKARMAATMQHFVDHFEEVPVVVLPCLERYREPNEMESASIYPAVQNLLLAARGLGYGGVFTGFNKLVEEELRELLEVPDHVFMAGTVTIGRPVGHHGPVRRRPLSELVYAGVWGESAPWAIDPPGTEHTQAGPPKQRG
jgi:nitroreductase